MRPTQHRPTQAQMWSLIGQPIENGGPRLVRVQPIQAVLCGGLSHKCMGGHMIYARHPIGPKVPPILGSPGRPYLVALCLLHTAYCSRYQWLAPSRNSRGRAAGACLQPPVSTFRAPLCMQAPQKTHAPAQKHVQRGQLGI